MKTHEFGKSDTVLIQPVGKHELPWIENEVREIHRLTSADFKYIAVEIDDWNDDLSPWKAQAVFKDDDFGGGAVKTLEWNSGNHYREPDMRTAKAFAWILNHEKN